MIRARFKTHAEDWRPVSWPVKHPYWCTGYGEDRDGEYAVIVAYADDEDEVKHFWPEAYDIDSPPTDGYHFTSRFPRPEWFTE